MAKRCGPVFAQQDIVTAFVTGISKDLSPLLRVECGDLTGSRAFMDYFERAAAIGDAHRALIGKEKPYPRPQHVGRIRALSMESGEAPGQHLPRVVNGSAPVLAMSHGESQQAHSEPYGISELDPRDDSYRPRDSVHTIVPALCLGITSYAQPPFIRDLYEKYLLHPS